MKRGTRQPEYKNQGSPRWLGLLIGLLVASLLLGAYRLYSVLNEVGLTGLLPGATSDASRYLVQLEKQPVYRIKKKQELLGMNVVRIVSKRQPEEFLVLDGVSRKLVDSVYAKPVDLPWANVVANQFLKLRESGEDASPISVDIQEVKTLKADTIRVNGRTLPCWQVQVRFKLSNESESRYYEALVVRNARGEEAPKEKDSLVVAYAQKEAFQKELLADLMKNLRFEQN